MTAETMRKLMMIVEGAPPPSGGIDWTPGGGSREVKIGDTTICYGVGGNSDYPDGRFAEVISLRTKTRATGAGSARHAMETFVHAADAAGITLRLIASPLTKRTSLPRLVKFYRSLGFEITGKTANPAGDPYMIRPCRAERQGDPIMEGSDLGDDNDGYDDDDEDAKYAHLPSSAAIKALRPKIAAEAQAVYDQWDQSDPENDDLNGGGICHLIADEVCHILSGAGIPCASETATDVQHV